jgi:hypothetical protein
MILPSRPLYVVLLLLLGILPLPHSESRSVSPLNQNSRIDRTSFFFFHYYSVYILFPIKFFFWFLSIQYHKTKQKTKA